MNRKNSLASKLKKAAAFTLVELIIVIAIISILAAIVVLTVDPATLFAKARNANRANDMTTLQSALQRFIADSGTTSATARALYTTASITGANVAIGNGGTIGTPNSAGLVGGPGASSAGAYTASPTGACVAGSNGTLTSGTSGFTILTTGTATGTNIDFSSLITAGYLTKVPTDPLGGSNVYKACIDTGSPAGSTNSAPGKLVLFSPNFETVAGATIPYAVI